MFVFLFNNSSIIIDFAAAALLAGAAAQQGTQEGPTAGALAGPAAQQGAQQPAAGTLAGPAAQQGAQEPAAALAGAAGLAEEQIDQDRRGDLQQPWKPSARGDRGHHCDAPRLHRAGRADRDARSAGQKRGHADDQTAEPRLRHHGHSDHA